MSNKLIWHKSNHCVAQQQIIATTLIKFDFQAMTNYPDLALAVHYRITVNADQHKQKYKLQIISTRMRFRIDSYDTLEAAYAAAQNYHNQFTAKPIGRDTNFSKYQVLLLRLLGLDLSLICQDFLQKDQAKEA